MSVRFFCDKCKTEFFPDIEMVEDITIGEMNKKCGCSTCWLEHYMETHKTGGE